MKPLITILTMIFISFGANSSTTEQYFKYCKAFQKNSFKIETDTDLACEVAFIHLVEFGEANCRWYKMLRSQTPDAVIEVAYSISLGRVSIEPVSVSAAIQTFLNWAEKNQKEWKYRLSDNFEKFLGKKFPCDIKKKDHKAIN